MIKATVKINDIEVKAFGGKLRSVLPRMVRKGLGKASFFIMKEIKTRTLSGQDFRRRKFRPYAVGTGQGRKENRGTVDLFDTGQMQNSMNFTYKSNFKTQLGFRSADANKKAYYHDVEGVGKAKVKREFFSVDKQTEQKATAMFIKEIERSMGLL
jgi:hypothetical protein